MTRQAHLLAYSAEHPLAAPPEVVFDAIAAFQPGQTDPAVFGTILGVEPAWGTPGAAGYQAVVRVNWGVVDLHMRETMRDVRRPGLIVLTRRPERYTVYDPSERMPPMGSDIPDDPAAAFRAAYGAMPPATTLRIELEADGPGTRMRVTLHLNMDVKPGWLARRMWKRQNRKEVEAMFARVQAQL